MKKSLVLGAVTLAAMSAGSVFAGTADDVKARGTLNCGVSTGVPGFAQPDADGVWQGFDVAVCRAVAAAVLGDGNAVEFVPTTGKTRFTALASGEIDMLARNTTWTFSRDVDLKFEFTGVNYYDGQGFMVPKALGVASATELDGATVCIQTGTTTELNLADFFRSNSMSYEPVPIETGSKRSLSTLPVHVMFTQQTRLLWRLTGPTLKHLATTWFCQKSFQKSLWALLFATAITTGVISYAGL